MKKVIALILLAALLCVGCGETAPAETTEATAAQTACYILYAIGPEDDLLEADMLEDELVRMGYGYDEMYIAFYSDGTGHINLMGVDADICYDETSYWLETAPENRTEFTIEDNILTIDNNGYLYIFEG